MDLNSFIRNIPDFPIPGIIFRDITPMLADAKAFDTAVEKMIEPFASEKIQKVAAVESRGFIFGSMIASKMGVGFVPIRKKGKLPFKTITETYSLEYGEASIEAHTDAFNEGERILLIDDVLATGGTMAAACRLAERQNAIIAGISFLCELDALNGRKLLPNVLVHSVLRF
ncbi:MAG: adenine phosphoribosyltransferase [Fibromonadaceae bacterium]|jgi:adenine phosphoribosyltransferase|nr:adenine phosphoribosyltransferase [Fibromonadaceae bacterium]